MYLHPLISELPPAERSALVKRSELRSYKRNEVVVAFGEKTSNIYCIASGLARVVVPAGDDEGVTTEFVRQDDFFMGPSMTASTYHADASLIAALPTTVYLVPSVVMTELCLKYPNVSLGLFELARKRLVLLRAQLRRIGSQSSEKLISRILHELTQIAPTASGGYDKRITQSVIASYSGLSREQVNKTIRDLEGRGLVTKDADGVNVPPDFAATDFRTLPIEETLPNVEPNQGPPTFFPELFDGTAFALPLPRKKA
jgi:CRP/FNR family cyclic AMP-dependent transcriptional regulator